MTWSHFPPSKPMLVYALYSVLKKLFFLNNLEGALNTKSRNSLFDRAYRRRNTTRSKNGSPQQRHLDNLPSALRSIISLSIRRIPSRSVHCNFFLLFLSPQAILGGLFACSCIYGVCRILNFDLPNRFSARDLFSFPSSY
jgi:hypothetical protein